MVWWEPNIYKQINKLGPSLVTALMLHANAVTYYIDIMITTTTVTSTVTVAITIAMLLLVLPLPLLL